MKKLFSGNSWKPTFQEISVSADIIWPPYISKWRTHWIDEFPQPHASPGAIWKRSQVSGEIWSALILYWLSYETCPNWIFHVVPERPSGSRACVTILSLMKSNRSHLYPFSDIFISSLLLWNHSIGFHVALSVSTQS